MNKSLRNFRYIAIIEGWSFLILLFVAMPLKYIAGIPEPVQFTGWIHGLLFMIYVALLVYTAFELRWKPLFIALAFIASLVPFGTFVLDRQLKKQSAEA